MRRMKDKKLVERVERRRSRGEKIYHGALLELFYLDRTHRNMWKMEAVLNRTEMSENNSNTDKVNDEPERYHRPTRAPCVPARNSYFLKGTAIPETNMKRR